MNPLSKLIVALTLVGAFGALSLVAAAGDGGLVRVAGEGRMVRIPAGSFLMGSNTMGPAEAPEHRVHLAEYLIDRYEVTTAEYDACTAAGVCAARRKFSKEGGPSQPVVGITWNDATTFCGWRGARLPTEAEWEKAARGSGGRIYPWGDTVECGVANIGNGINRDCPDAPGRTVPVGSIPTDVSPYGVYDMGGNAWEYVADWYDASYFASSPSSNPRGPAMGKGRVVKGGSWYSPRLGAHASARTSRTHSRTEYDGFRCAADSKTR